MKDRFHNGVSHEFFLNAGFCEKYWVPFLKSGTIVPGDLPAENRLLWAGLISIFKLEYFIAAVAIVLLAFAILWLQETERVVTQQCYRFNPQSGEQSNSLGLPTCFPGKIVYVKYWDPTDYAALAKERDPTRSPSSWPIDQPNRVFQARGLTNDGHLQWVEQNLKGITNRLENWGGENHYWGTAIENTGIGRDMIARVKRSVTLTIIRETFSKLRTQPLRERYGACASQIPDVGFCAGFSDACITKPSTRSHDRRPRSAKARNRGPEGALFRRCDLWGFEECERLFSRGRDYGRTAS